MGLRFLLDEDLSPRIAVIARGLSVDVISIHELGRTGLSDEEQLRYAAEDDRILVTRNRDDFIVLTKRFFATNETHCGTIIVPRRFTHLGPNAVAQALRNWAGRYDVSDPGAGFIDFLVLPISSHL